MGERTAPCSSQPLGRRVGSRRSAAERFAARRGSTIGTVVRGSGKTLIDVVRYSPVMLTGDFQGDVEYGPLWAGESCSLVNDIRPAAALFELSPAKQSKPSWPCSERESRDSTENLDTS